MNINETIKKELKKHCQGCENYGVEMLFGYTVGGCKCGINPLHCSLNEFGKALKESCK